MTHERGHESPQIVNSDIHICLAGLKRVGTPFPGHHFCNLAFPGLKQHFSHAKRIVLSMGTQVLGRHGLFQVIPLRLGVTLLLLKFSSELVDLNLVMITARLEIQGAHCKIERDPQIFTGSPGICTVPITLKLHFNPCCSVIITEHGKMADNNWISFVYPCQHRHILPDRNKLQRNLMTITVNNFH